jgi:hypothetical protein
MLFNKIQLRKRWLVKLPTIIGVLFLIISVPCLFNHSGLSLHANDYYTRLYSLVNMPIILSVGYFSDDVARLLFHEPNQYESKVVLIIISWLFLIIISFFVGFVIDYRKLIKQSSSA